MSNATTNGAKRVNLKAVALLRLAKEMPADAEVTTANTTLAIADCTYFDVLSGFPFDMSDTMSDPTIEGSREVLERALETKMQAVKQSPEDIETMKAKFDRKACDLILLYCDPDKAVNKATNVVTASVGDIMGILPNILPSMMEDYAPNKEPLMDITFSKIFSGDESKFGFFKTIVADT